MKVVMYCRVANDDGFSLEHQKTALTNYALAQGYSVQDTIAEVASGISDNRHGLQKVLAAVSSGDVNAVLVDSVSRLYRSPLMYFDFKHKVESHGAKLLSRMNDTTDETEEIMKAIIASAMKARHTSRK